MIPRKFHRIWFGTRPRPAKYDEYWKKWQELHPDAEFHTWTEDNLPELVNAAAYKAVAFTAKAGAVPMSHERAVAVMRADIVAYELIHQFGGVYLNCDITPLRPLDRLMTSQAFIGREDDYYLCNAVMAAVPNHPLFTDVIQGLRKNLRQFTDHGMEKATGPQYLTSVFKSKLYDVEVLPSYYFYPLSHAVIPHGQDMSEYGISLGKKYQSYAVHMWGHKTQEGILGA